MKSTRPAEPHVVALTVNDKAVFLPAEEGRHITWQEELSLSLRMDNEYIRLFLAEFIGTFLLVSVGVGSGAQAVLSKGQDGNFVTTAIGWGVAVAMGVYASGGVSGGHINPAVTTAMAVLGRLQWRTVPVYLLGQYIGALFGSVAVYAVYFDGLSNYTGPIETASIWATYPKPHVTTGEGFVDQVFVTGLLLTYVMAINDERNMAVPKGVHPLVVGFGVTGLISAFSTNCGAALNPARDFGPRLFTMMAGWGADPITFRDGNWFWVPILGPHIGAIFGAFFYNLCVGLHWPSLHTQMDKKHRKS